MARLKPATGIIARSLCFIMENKAGFNFRGDRYITYGFSAGGYLTCLWHTPDKARASFGLLHRASFPICSPASLRKRSYDPDCARLLYGNADEEAALFRSMRKDSRLPRCFSCG